MKRVVGIAGAGSMGRGIAQVAAMSGWEVRLYDLSIEALDAARIHHHQIMNMLTKKGKIDDAEAKAFLSRIYYQNDLDILKDASLIIEAIVEDLSIKHAFFDQLGEIVADDAMVGSNTSSLSVTEIGAGWKKPENFLGIHFFKPAPLMSLVELVNTARTSEKVIHKCRQIITNWGKQPVLAKDSPGFIVNKVARPYYSEALRIYEEGLAQPAVIDREMEKNGFRMGPFTLMDFIGHDVNYAVTASVWKAFYHEPRYQPSHVQLGLVRAGNLGRKSGQGFYEWVDKKPVRPESGTKNEDRGWIFDRIIGMLINEAADTIEKGICSELDVEIAMKLGANYPRGLLDWGREIGYDVIVHKLDELFDYYHDPRYRASPWLRKKAN